MVRPVEMMMAGDSFRLAAYGRPKTDKRLLRIRRRRG